MHCSCSRSTDIAGTQARSCCRFWRYHSTVEARLCPGGFHRFTPIAMNSPDSSEDVKRQRNPLAASIRTLATCHGGDGLEDDPEIGDHRPVVDV